MNSKEILIEAKPFALGIRIEHPQQIIDSIQYHSKSRGKFLPAATYQLVTQVEGKGVFSFCMCPGGMVVPAATYSHVNIVNGMSNYLRNGPFANAGCVAGVHPDQLAGRQVTALEALQWIEDLEHAFFAFSGGYSAPFCTINDFLKGTDPRSIPETSYPLGLKPAPLWNMFPAVVTNALREGMKDFDHRMHGYSQGNLLGLESKTSSPIQVLREKNGLCTGFGNLFLAGEGSGFAGGIVSSAADGIKIAMNIMEKEN